MERKYICKHRLGVKGWETNLGIKPGDSLESFLEIYDTYLEGDQELAWVFMDRARGSIVGRINDEAIK